MIIKTYRICFVPKSIKRKNIKKNDFIMFDFNIKNTKEKLIKNLYILKLFNLYIKEKE